MKTADKFIGCLLGGSIGDAFGYPIEFLKLFEIYDLYGDNGVEDLYVNKFDKVAQFSDDTQMTLFTVEGILNFENKTEIIEKHSISTCLFYSYERWLYTQGYPLSTEYEFLTNVNSSCLYKYKQIFSQRAPGNSCITALIKANNHKYGTLKRRITRSKGCGGVMRSAPAGLYYSGNNYNAFKLGCDLAAITHGHPSGYLPAGALSSIISDLMISLPIETAIQNALKALEEMEGKLDTVSSIKKALLLAAEGNPSAEKLSQLGEGWVGDEALAIGLYSTLCYPNDFKKALMLSVNHSGDSDTTGSICGTIMGAKLGVDSIPNEWIKKLELSTLIIEMAQKLYKVSKTNVEKK